LDSGLDSRNSFASEAIDEGEKRSVQKRLALVAPDMKYAIDHASHRKHGEEP
jgi:hypothetical protein